MVNDFGDNNTVNVLADLFKKNALFFNTETTVVTKQYFCTSELILFMDQQFKILISADSGKMELLKTCHC